MKPYGLYDIKSQGTFRNNLKQHRGCKAVNFIYIHTHTPLFFFLIPKIKQIAINSCYLGL